MLTKNIEMLLRNCEDTLMHNYNFIHAFISFQTPVHFIIQYTLNLGMCHNVCS